MALKKRMCTIFNTQQFEFEALDLNTEVGIRMLNREYIQTNQTRP